MSPRPYRLGQRQGPVDEGRLHVLEAARRLLSGADRYGAFTVDAVARQADVARATVYYQFGSKTGLLEAVCDHLGDLGGMSGLASAFAEQDPVAALRGLVTVFGQLWAADRPAMRRLRALARLDPEVGAVIEVRDQRRRDALTVMVTRLADAGLRDGDPARAVRLLMALTSFETFDAIAGEDQEITAAVPEITALAQAAISLPS